MSPPNFANADHRDPFAFLNVLRDPSGASTSRLTQLPGLEDSDDEDARYGADFDDPDNIPGESPNASQSTAPGHGHSQDIDDDEEDMDEDDREFGRERRRREAEGSDDDDDEGEEADGYELRRNINRDAFKGSGYTDLDQSGNYNPEEEGDEELEMARTGRGRKRLSDRKRDRKGKGKAKPRRSSSRVGAEDDAEDDETRDPVDNQLDDDVAAMDGLDLNGASQSPDPAAEDEDEDDEDDDISIEDMGANSDVDPDELRLRKAAKKRMPPKPRKNTPPKPQSCTSCKKLRLDCSINDEPGSYPCLNCLEQRCGCILPTPYTAEQKNGSRKAATKQRAAEKESARKKAAKERELLRQHELRISNLKRADKEKKRAKRCTCCKDLDKKCSHEDLGWNELRGTQCKRCVKNHTICELDLRARREVERDDPVREEERRPLPRGQRPLPAFGSAAFDRPDELDEDDIGDPIDRVTQDGEPAKKRGRKSKKKGAALSLNQSPGEAFVCAPGYAKKQITTSFAHPLVFNAPVRADSSEEDGTACDLHTVAFSIFGHPIAKPWVTYPSPYPSASTINQTFSYREIPGTSGHTESTPHSQTNVCKTCTFLRQKILFCPSHVLSGIKSLPKPKDFDFDAAYNPLLSDQEHGFCSNEAGNTKWCSVCPAPAFLECVCRGALSVRGEREGCGLVVCEICAVGLLTAPGENEEVVKRMEEVATKEVQMLLRDVKKVNLAARQALLNPGQPVRERAFVQVRRELDDVIAEAKEMCEHGGGKGGKYMDGVRADVELISRRGWLWEWMSNEAERQRQIEWSRSGIASANRGVANVAGGARPSKA